MEIPLCDRFENKNKYIPDNKANVLAKNGSRCRFHKQSRYDSKCLYNSLDTS